MAKFFKEESRTFNEYLLVPGLSTRENTPSNVDLTTPLVRFKKGEESTIKLKLPMISAIMQSVSNDTMAIALAKEGGVSFIYGSQTIEQQAEMVRKVKTHKAGFVISDSNVKPENTIAELLEVIERTGHSTVAVTDDGKNHGILKGIITSRDYRLGRVSLDDKVEKYMTPIEKLVCGHVSLTLSECNDLIWDNKLNSLPILDDEKRLVYLVFRKDYEAHKEHPNELLDEHKRFIVGAGINTRDYETRVPALVEAGVDVLCIDSSEGFTEYQKDTIAWIHEKYDGRVKVGAGNIVDEDGFRFLADAGADFIKIGIGGGSICITRETKGIGRGQATAVIEVAKARDEYFEETGIYVPICSDGGIVYDHHISLALAMGADFVMLGRYFSRFEESPTNKIMLNGSYYKEYWGEGSNRARNWQRYDVGQKSGMSFEEGVDSYVPYAGYLRDNVRVTTAKIKSTMSNCGANNLTEFRDKARLTLVSSTSIVEGGAHDVVVKKNSNGQGNF